MGYNLDVAGTSVETSQHAVQASQSQQWPSNVHHVIQTVRAGMPGVHLDPVPATLDREAVVIEHAGVEQVLDLGYKLLPTLLLPAALPRHLGWIPAQAAVRAQPVTDAAVHFHLADV